MVIVESFMLYACRVLPLCCFPGHYFIGSLSQYWYYFIIIMVQFIIMLYQGPFQMSSAKLSASGYIVDIKYKIEISKISLSLSGNFPTTTYKQFLQKSFQTSRSLLTCKYEHNFLSTCESSFGKSYHFTEP